MDLTKESAKSVILYFRCKKNLSQIELAKMVGVSTLTIHNIESGKFKPNNMTLHKLNQYFNSVKLYD